MAEPYNLHRSVLPTHVQAWPLASEAFQTGASVDAEEASLDDVRRYSAHKAWLWPNRLLLFFCDIHADTDAFLLSLTASGGVERTGPGDRDYELTARGRRATFVIGGDCFDKGPNN